LMNHARGNRDLNCSHIKSKQTAPANWQGLLKKSESA